MITGLLADVLNCASREGLVIEILYRDDKPDALIVGCDACNDCLIFLSKPLNPDAIATQVIRLILAHPKGGAHTHVRWTLAGT